MYSSIKTIKNIHIKIQIESMSDNIKDSTYMTETKASGHYIRNWQKTKEENRSHNLGSLDSKWGSHQ